MRIIKWGTLILASILFLSCTQNSENHEQQQQIGGDKKSTVKELDYGIKGNRFFTSEGEIPNGCFGQLMTELNGDNSVAAIFINRAELRGCIDANFPYPGGVEEEVTYEINKALAGDAYQLTVCQEVHGSMGESCDKIVVRFVNRDYTIGEDVKKVLSLGKIGEW